MIFMGMQIGVGEFKARCLAILEELHQNGGQVFLTKRGRAIACISPIMEGQEPDQPLEGVQMRPDWR